jgi:Membrane dipeptidase (Peptidase family M19)
MKMILNHLCRKTVLFVLILIFTQVTPSVGQGLVNDIDFDNWRFEKGLNGWSKVGSAFSNQPTYGDNVLTDRVLTAMDYAKGGIGGNYWKEMAYPIGHKGSYWIGTYENRPTANATVGKTQGNPPVGSLFSSEFKITKKSCDFLLGGSAGNVNVSVELQTKTADGKWTTSLKVSPATNTDQMYRNVFDLKPFAGKTARIAIIDNATNGYINVDDFRFFDDAQEYIRIGNKLLDKDVPVWGFADTHAHPTSQEGFGGKTLIGNPGDPLEITYSGADCLLRHTPNLFVGIADPHIYGLGYPNFAGFPRFNSKTHQQQHVDFLKRAKEGGLRLYCALSVTNMYLPSRAVGAGNDGKPIDDESVMYRELDLLKNIALTQKSWMEIAYTPQDARRIIQEGKLAVVLGIEADNLGNFKSPTYRWKDVVRDRPMVALTESNADTKLDAKLSEYYNYGIRQITPIHYISGVFGGAAVFRGETALVQFEFNGKVNVKGGVSRKVGYSLYEDFNVGASFVGSGLIYPTYVTWIQKMNEEAEICMVNADGMTSIGEKLVKKMMQRGFLIDSEHMSYESKDDLFNMAKVNNNYPIMSSHTDPHGLSFNWKGTPRRFNGSNEDKFKYFGTTTIRNVAQEGQLLNEHYQRIKELGGTVGLFLLPYTKLAYTGKWGSIPNDCAGSSKTWAQMYLHSLDQLDGKGVAFSSDRGMVDFIAPRFGVNAAYSMKEENDLSLKIRVRKKMASAMTEPVKATFLNYLNLGEKLFQCGKKMLGKHWQHGRQVQIPLSTLTKSLKAQKWVTVVVFSILPKDCLPAIKAN